MNREGIDKKSMKKEKFILILLLRAIFRCNLHRNLCQQSGKGLGRSGRNLERGLNLEHFGLSYIRTVHCLRKST